MSLKSHPALPLKPHKVVVLALPNLIAFDLSIPLEVFGRATLGEHPCYRVSVCGESQEIEAAPFGLRLKHGLQELADAQTIIVPGIERANELMSPAIHGVLREANARGARIASICSGAFVLAQAGLLDGLRATTHWKAAPLLMQLYPRIEVDARVLFVDEGRILTSAGAAAGIDLCLHMVKADFGASVAAEVARLSIVPLQRDGGQAQFIALQGLSAGKSLEPLTTWALGKLHRSLSLEVLADKAGSSQRTLNRRFQEQLGVSPAQWLMRARIKRGQELLESTSLTIEQIVSNVGLGSAANFRAQFARLVGVSPSEYKRNFGAAWMDGKHQGP